MAEGLQYRPRIHSRVLEILERGPKRRPAAGHRGEFVEPGEIRISRAQPLVHPFPKKGFASQSGCNLTALFFQQPRGQLVKRQEMNVEKRLALLNAESPFEMRAQTFRGNEDQARQRGQDVERAKVRG